MSKIKLETANRKIEYEEYARAYTEHYSADSQLSSRILAVAWDSREQFREDMLGWSENVGGVLTRNPPERHPENPRLFCTECQMQQNEGEHSQNAAQKGMPKYDKAVYQCTYRAVPYRVIGDDEMDEDLPTELDRFVIRKKLFGFEMQKLPGIDLVFDAPGKSWDRKPLGEVPSIPVSVINLEYTVKEIPLELIPDVVTKGNTINAADFDDAILLGDITLGPYAPRRVLFSGFAQKEYLSAKGISVADLVYSFAVRAVEWNYFPGPDGTMYKIIRTSDSSKSIFSTSDFNELFEFTEIP